MTPKWHIQGIEALASFKSPDQWHYSKQPVKPDGPYFVPCTETDTLHFDDHQILTVMIGGICKTIEFRYQLGLRTAAIENGKFAISEQSIKLAFRPIILKS